MATKPKCNNGTDCGFTCIDAKDSCNLALPDGIKQQLDKAKEALLSADTIVNTAGFVGSVVGGHLAGPHGALAGDLLGAMGARIAVETTKYATNANAKLKADEEFGSSSVLQKAKQIANMAYSDMLTQKEAFGNAIDDASGWAIGNGTANLLQALAPPPLNKVPLTGAAVAILTVPKLSSLRKSKVGFSEQAKPAESAELTRAKRLLRVLFRLPKTEQFVAFDYLPDKEAHLVLTISPAGLTHYLAMGKNAYRTRLLEYTPNEAKT